MKRIALFIAAAAVAAVVAFTAHASGQADQVVPVFGVLFLRTTATGD